MPRLRTQTRRSASMRRACAYATGVLAYIIPVHEILADVASDFVSGSGFTAIGQIGTILKPVSLALAFFWAIWGIVSEARALGAGNGDSAGLGAAFIRGAFLPVLVATVILVLT